MLTTLLKPTEGKAWVAGYDVVEQPHQVRKRIGVVFQDVALDWELTGFENLWIYGMIQGVGERELREKVPKLLEFVGLSGWADTQVKRYSGGMMRRLEIAQIMVHSPEIIFLDEPTLGLDPQTRVHVWDYIRELRSEFGTTVFLTTHYMEEAEKLCDRVAIIDHGKIIALGTPEELVSKLEGEVVYVRFEQGLNKAAVERVGELGCVLGVRVVEGDRVAVSVRRASEAIPEIIDACSKAGAKVAEVTYHRPSLEDVFISLTGRGLRDEKWDWVSHMRLSRARRMR